MNTELIFKMEAEELMECKLKKNYSDYELVKILEKDLREYVESCDHDGNFIGDDDVIDEYKNLINSIRTNDYSIYIKKYKRLELERQKKREENWIKRQRKIQKKLEQKTTQH